MWFMPLFRQFALICFNFWTSANSIIQWLTHTPSWHSHTHTLLFLKLCMIWKSLKLRKSFKLQFYPCNLYSMKIFHSHNHRKNQINLVKYNFMWKNFVKTEIWTQDLWHDSPLPYPLYHADLMKFQVRKNGLIQRSIYFAP